MNSTLKKDPTIPNKEQVIFCCHRCHGRPLCGHFARFHACLTEVAFPGCRCDHLPDLSMHDLLTVLQVDVCP